METNVISRKDFLKKVAYGSLGLLALIKLGTIPVHAEPVSEDNSIVQSNAAPEDHSVMWLNTGSGINADGVNGMAVPNGAMCYWDAEGNGWKPTAATWA